MSEDLEKQLRQIGVDNEGALFGSEVATINKAADALAASREKLAAVEGERDAALERIENAAQAASETQPSWERRCYRILSSLGLDFGDPTPELPEQSGYYVRKLKIAEARAETAEACATAAEAREARLRAGLEGVRRHFIEVLAHSENSVALQYIDAALTKDLSDV